jgi:glyoxylase-like metal-dependent hydrolase (beta-lactamase superfamily II)
MCVKCGLAFFTGDTLFKENCGRCDLPGGDYSQMLKSLNRISKLEGDLTIHPGHGEMSSLSHERQFNPYMRESQ